MQRSGDQVAEAADSDDVLRGEEPVVARQVHPSAHGDRLAQQPAAELPGGGRGDEAGEEQPDVRAQTGTGYLQSRRCAGCAGRLEVGERIEHGGGAVEVGASQWQRSPSISGYSPSSSSPDRWAVMTSSVSGRYPRSAAGTLLRQPPRTAGTQPARPVRAFSHRTA